ncbi:hypothetical protein FQR65_LT09197 [Abscondita terminalis]|nr:hypothetical protein FQR65_LT09197 [Abscondita terminalis]
MAYRGRVGHHSSVEQHADSDFTQEDIEERWNEADYQSLSDENFLEKFEEGRCSAATKEYDENYPLLNPIATIKSEDALTQIDKCILRGEENSERHDGTIFIPLFLGPWLHTLCIALSRGSGTMVLNIRINVCNEFIYWFRLLRAVGVLRHLKLNIVKLRWYFFGLNRICPIVHSNFVAKMDDFLPFRLVGIAKSELGELYANLQSDRKSNIDDDDDDDWNIPADSDSKDDLPLKQLKDRNLPSRSQRVRSRRSNRNRVA